MMDIMDIIDIIDTFSLWNDRTLIEYPCWHSNFLSTLCCSCSHIFNPCPSCELFCNPLLSMQKACWLCKYWFYVDIMISDSMPQRFITRITKYSFIEATRPTHHINIVCYFSFYQMCRYLNLSFVQSVMKIDS